MSIKPVQVCLAVLLVLSSFGCRPGEDEENLNVEIKDPLKETREAFDARMDWWREARFGLFIHWGLYAVPAGEWNGETNHAEWILQTAEIPVDEYEGFAPQFNPIKFDAADWVRIAKDAGMKYIVITSKHHDGFCLFDSAQTDYDVMDATPFKRDIMKELAEECRKQGLKICWYHSIMDWHHPDYLPRRSWEKRPSDDADFNRYVEYMKAQVKELVTHYGEIGVLWFDGEWEATWTPDRGMDLYRHVRSLQPDIIINNRVGKGRAGMAGTYDPAGASGDFGTPEQEIPATGLDYDWETCMTMNDHWGYNKNDDHWKSETDLIQKLSDIASKGGNFLLNVGPTAEGLFPQESVDRLAAMGRWMKTNGESIYGTSAGRFEKLEWGRSTTKGRTLYFHVFDWPVDGRLIVPGLLSKADRVFLLSSPGQMLDMTLEDGRSVIRVPSEAPDTAVSVIACTFSAEPEIVRSPKIEAESDIFTDSLEVRISTSLNDPEIRFTLDDSAPTEKSALYSGPITLDETATVSCRIFQSGRPISETVKARFVKVSPRPATEGDDLQPGLVYLYCEGEWDRLPDFTSSPIVSRGTASLVDLSVPNRKELFGLRFDGFIEVPETGVYIFALDSDDGSRLWIGEDLVVDNDGLHGSERAVGRYALEKGKHPLRIAYFNKTGGSDLAVFYSGPGFEMRTLPAEVLYHR